MKKVEKNNNDSHFQWCAQYSIRGSVWSLVSVSDHACRTRVSTTAHCCTCHGWSNATGVAGCIDEDQPSGAATHTPRSVTGDSHSTAGINSTADRKRACVY